MGALQVLLACGSMASESVSARQSWTATLNDEETARCTEIAWQAAESAEIQAEHRFERITSAPLKLSRTGIQYYVSRSDRSRVEVAIPSGTKYGGHSTYIGVTVSRDTYAVLSMREAPWL